MNDLQRLIPINPDIQLKKMRLARIGLDEIPDPIQFSQLPTRIQEAQKLLGTQKS